MLEGDGGHFREVFVEQKRNLLRLHALGSRGEILDVGEEDRELLALGVDRDVGLTGEYALVDLRREVPRDLGRHRGEELVVRLELAVHAVDRGCLAPLQGNESEAARGGEAEVDQQVFERPDVGRDRLGDGDLLNAAYVADLPVGLGTFRVGIVAGHARRSHYDRADVPDAVGEQRPVRLRRLPVRVVSERGQRPGLELVERMSRAVLEGKVGYEPVGNIRLLFADDAPELERKRRGNGNGAGDLFVVGEDLGRPR